MRLSPALALIAGCALGAGAQESFTVGPRALGMGGTGVAAVDDVPAQYYNPAAYGFFAHQPPAEEQSDKGPFSADNNALWRKDWGAAVDFTLGARIHKDFAEHVDTLRGYNDDGTFDRLGAAGAGGGLNNEADALALVEIANALGNLGDPDNAMTMDNTGGLSVRVKHFGIGVRSYSQVFGRLQNLDLANLGVGDSGDLNTELNGITPSGSGSVLTAAQQTQLSNAGITGANITKLDQLAASSGIPADQLQLMVDALVEVSGAAGGSIDDNTTSLRLYGVNIIEVPLSFGWAFNENISVGGNLKAMVGRVYGTDVLVFDDDIDDALTSADDNYEQSVTWGIDLGVMVRLRMLNLGLTLRNLNAPTFDGPTVGAITYPDYEIDPSATLGAAFIPYEWLTLAADVDLTSNETVLSNYDSQMFRLGAEFDLFRILALRGGYSQNLAESDIGPLVHAGLGVNLWAVRIDLAGAMALETTTYDGDEVPREVRAGLQLAADF
jgi:hypothetical protein